jgi:hypothetical protein
MRFKNRRKWGRRVNIVEISCTHVWKWKNETLKLFLEWGGRRIGEECRSEFNYDIL